MAKKTTRVKQETIKEVAGIDARIVANGRAWQQHQPPSLPQAVAAAEVSRLLALANGAEVTIAGRSWRCRAQQLLPAAQSTAKNTTNSSVKSVANSDERTHAQYRWSLLLSLGGVSCLCRTELPSSVRAELETMSEPYRLEELPASVALGLLSLALSPVLQELFLVECRLVEHNLVGRGLGVEKKTCAKDEVAFRIEATPVTQEGAEDPSCAPVFLQVFLAASDLEAFGRAFGRALRVKRLRRRYPPNLYTTWKLDGGATSISVEEFRALREGDVLLLS